MNCIKTTKHQEDKLKANIPWFNPKIKGEKLRFPYHKDYSKLDKWQILRELSKDYQGKVHLRLEWMIFYETISDKNAKYTSEHFGISRRTFHKWHKRFKDSKSNIESLVDVSKAPINRRTPMINGIEEYRIKDIRKKYMRYGRSKIKKIYQNMYEESISTHKIQRVINTHNLYIDKKRQKKYRIKRARLLTNPKTRIMNYIKDINELGIGTLWHIDFIILHFKGHKRGVLTGIDHVSKIGYARVYTNPSSKSAEDFLKRLNYLVEGKIEVIHSDNGTEFEGLFKKACEIKGIHRVYSRAHTPNDNAINERFNRTLQEEWLEDSEEDLYDIDKSNKSLTKWLIEYNTHRPHQSLNYDTPLEFVLKAIDNSPKSSSSKVLPMYPAHTTEYLE